MVVNDLYVNVRVAFDGKLRGNYRSRCVQVWGWRLCQGGGGARGGARKHKGEPKLPFNCVVACSFYYEGGGLLLFLATVIPLLRIVRPPSGVKSKRIFLSADLLSR